MKNSGVSIIVILLPVLFLIDLYAFKGIRVLTGSFPPWLKISITISYWLVSLCITGGIAFAFYYLDHRHDPAYYRYFYHLFGLIVLFLLPKLVFIVFHFADDIAHVFKWMYHKIFVFTPELTAGGQKISRSVFLSRLGIALAAIPFISIAYGILKGRFDFRVIKKTLEFNRLPKAFDGLRIVQISDLHIGSFFNNHEAVEKGIAMVNELNADVIVFTGDMVNNYAKELDGWIPLLSSLKAKEKYSILGNHDYGDYAPWLTEEEKQGNLRQLIRHHKEMGFRLLLNESAVLEKEGERISILGVENWGRRPFVQHGDLNKAMQSAAADSFKILLSHDPSHWDAKVLRHTDIELTLSGHTHGMQFGVEIGSIKWSPVKMRYPRWAGLYREGKQLLYVNRGFGYIGFPGRVGMAPEITLIELKSVS